MDEKRVFTYGWEKIFAAIVPSSIEQIHFVDICLRPNKNKSTKAEKYNQQRMLTSSGGTAATINEQTMCWDARGAIYLGVG